MTSTNVIRTAVARWFSVILTVCACGTGGAYRQISKGQLGYWLAMCLLCEAQDNARFARALGRDLDNVETWTNMQLLAAARQLLHEPLNRAASSGFALPNLNPDVVQAYARRWHR